jgi:hypothetical protein
MSAAADNGIIETARKRRTYKYLTRPAQTSPRPLASERVIKRFSSLSPAADGGHGRRWSH